MGGIHLKQLSDFLGPAHIACHGIEEGRFDATIEMTAQTVSG
jgi:hypothetical protein